MNVIASNGRERATIPGQSTSELKDNSEYNLGRAFSEEESQMFTDLGFKCHGNKAPLEYDAGHNGITYGMPPHMSKYAWSYRK